MDSVQSSMNLRLMGELEIDFARFHQPAQMCPAEIAFDESGCPKILNVIVPGQLWNSLSDTAAGAYTFLNGATVHGGLIDGRLVDVRIGAAAGLYFDEQGRLRLAFAPRDIVIRGGQEHVPAVGDRWRFTLVNFGFKTGDIASPQPVPERVQKRSLGPSGFFK